MDAAGIAERMRGTRRYVRERDTSVNCKLAPHRDLIQNCTSLSPSFCLFLCVCFAWSLFSACEHFLLPFSCNATRSFSHSLLTRSETFLHARLTLALGSVCADFISSLLPYSAKEFLTFCLPSMAFFHSSDLNVTPEASIGFIAICGQLVSADF